LVLPKTKFSHNTKGRVQSRPFCTPPHSEKLHQFGGEFGKIGRKKYTCLLYTINVYLKENLNKEQLKELKMAFVSIGQKYGFVSAGDVFRKELADAQAETQKARDELNKVKAEMLKIAQEMVADKTISLEKAMEYFSLTKDQILA
jgi:hypothetical protein